MRIPLDRDSDEPLYRQIQRFLSEQIQAGALPTGTRLPATRELASSLEISRTTVTNAYAELEAEGLVFSQLGSGTFVAPLLGTLPEPAENLVSAGDWPLWQQQPLDRGQALAQQELAYLFASVAHPDLISFVGGVGAAQLFPVDDFRKAIQAVLRRDGPDALAYGDPAGYPPLRTTIAHILTSQGIPAHPDNVLITSGAQQALALIAYLLLRPGDVVLVESPTYVGAIALFRSMGVRLQGVPVDEQGMRVESVEGLLRTVRPRLVYVMANFQNPTGVCMSGQRRRQLVALANRYNVPILEDDYVGDLRYDGRAQPALKALDPGGHVMYVSTFSKVLMPGIRVGFLVAEGPVYERILAGKHTHDLATSTLMQRALEAYITVGRYQAHLRRVRRLYRCRRDAMLEALERYMPDGTRWELPQGGLFLWLQLPAGLSAEELHSLAGEEGVCFVPGSYFFHGKRPQSFLRLSFVVNPVEVIEEGARRLARAIERLLVRGDDEDASAPRHREVQV
ncbi:MAG: PLP-dependent aminotransferase family protein [Anaerolineae bacterium]|jgi:GntR family transcriptional regulator/MocR family aminotransferase